MTATLLIAPPASGKTHACLKTIAELHTNSPLAPVWVIVRDRLQAASFRNRLALEGGSFNVRVETFENLYLAILERAEVDMRPVASLALRKTLMQPAIARSQLDYLSPLKELPGFASTMYDRISELQRAAVEPEHLAALDNPLLDDIARLYVSYRGLLDRIGWINPDGLAELALEQLALKPHLLCDLPLLIVDGFDSFEPSQVRVLAALSQCIQHLLVTLPGHPEFKRSVDKRFRKAYDDLTRAAQYEVVTLEQLPKLPGELAILQAQLLEPGAEEVGLSSDQLSLIEARSPSEEAREALRWIKARIVRENISPSRCAVFIPNQEVYQPFLHLAAAEFGLPLHFQRGRRLTDKPTISALINLLNLQLLNFPARKLINTLRSPFFDLSPFQLNLENVDLLELVGRYGKVIEGLDQWHEVFDLLKRETAEQGGELDHEEDEGPRLPQLPKGPAAERLQADFHAVTSRLMPPEQQLSISAWIDWLEGLLIDFRFYPAEPQAVDSEARLALFGLRECLEGMLTSQSAMGEFGQAAVDYPEFISRLMALLGSMPISEETPINSGSILVLHTLDARGLRFDCAAVLGLSEGSFPTVERPDPLIIEEIRWQLGMPSKLEQEQLGLFYQMITRADHSLLLTRPYMADTGDPWEPSPFWNAVIQLFPKKVQHIRPSDLRPLSEAASAEELLFWAVRAGSELVESFEQLKLRLEEIQKGERRLRATIGNTTNQQEIDDLAALAAELHIGNSWSISRFEAYRSCPFRFYLEQVLKVEIHEIPTWDLDAAQLGSLLHAILERTFVEASDHSLPALLEKLDVVAAREFRLAPAKYNFRPSPLWREMQPELLERLRKTIIWLEEMEPGWTPIAFEQHFGSHAPFVLHVGKRRVSLRGVIDRIDQNAEGHLRVIDYKTGSSHLGKKDLEIGRRLQLPIYARAASELFGRETVDGFYYRIGSDGDQNSIRLSRFAAGEVSGIQAAEAVAVAHLERILDQLEQGHFLPDPIEGKCPSYCTGTPWCWHYHPERFD